MDNAKAQMRVLEEAASHEVAPEAPKKRRILKLKKKPEPPKAEEPKPKAEEPMPKAESPKKRTSAEIIDDLKKVVSEAKEASFEGGKFKKRDNWKGKAGYFKKIDALWKDYNGGADRFYGLIPTDLGWKPKQKEEGQSHASFMYDRHGINID